MTPGLRRLGLATSAAIETGPDGRPSALGDIPVEAVNEDWVVEDRWWSDRPLRRRYFELVLADGRNITVFREPASGRWFAQRA